VGRCDDSGDPSGRKFFIGMGTQGSSGGLRNPGLYSSAPLGRKKSQLVFGLQNTDLLLIPGTLAHFFQGQLGQFVGGGDDVDGFFRADPDLVLF